MKRLRVTIVFGGAVFMRRHVGVVAGAGGFPVFVEISRCPHK